MDALKKTIFKMLEKPVLSGLATVSEDGKPWVRYVMVTGDEKKGVLRTCTFLNSRKVAHVKKNPEVHITCGASTPESMTPYLQIQGTAEIVTSKKERHDFWNDHFKTYFQGPDDPNYCIMIVKPYRIELMEGLTPRVWEKK